MVRNSCALRRLFLVSPLAVVSLSAVSAFAQVSGFGLFSLNGYTQDNSGNIVDNNPPTVSAGTLTLTTAAAGEARAAYYKFPQSIGSFTAEFTYKNDPTSEPPLGAADGFAFVLHNDPRGLAAIGGGGAGLGYGLKNNNQPLPPATPLTPVTNSAAVEFFLRNGSGATAYQTGGAIDTNSGTSSSPVSLEGGDPILVTLVYNGSLLTETLTDQKIPADTYTTTFAADIPSAVGGSTAFIGFTGGTGGGFSTQTISNFTFAAVPEPTSVGLLVAGAIGLCARRRRV